MTMRNSPLGAWGTLRAPCHVPLKVSPNRTPACNTMSANEYTNSFFMGYLLGELRQDRRYLSRSVATGLSLCPGGTVTTVAFRKTPKKPIAQTASVSKRPLPLILLLFHNTTS